MRITERQLRRLVREMALKGINIAQSQKMDDITGKKLYVSPDEPGSRDVGYDVEGLPPADSEAFYQAAVRTWGRESYKSYAARQFERFPIGLNVFLVPGAKGPGLATINTPERFTDPDDAAMNQEGLRIVRQHFPDVPIDDDDFNIVILTKRQSFFGIFGIEPDNITNISPPPKKFLDTEGIYNTFHALFDGGVLRKKVFDSSSVGTVYETKMEMLVYEVCRIVSDKSDASQELFSMGASSPLNQIFRLRTLKMKRINNLRELVNELCTVALIRNTVPVRPDEFPTHDMYGFEIPEEERNKGIDLVNQMIPFLELARDSWRDLAGKTIIGGPTAT